MILVSLLSSLVALLLLIVTLGGRIFPRAVARAMAALDRQRCGLTLRRCEVVGLAMPYLEGGSGEPLVLLHGLGGQKEQFAQVASELREHSHVFIPDLPGFGNASRDPQTDYHIDAQAARVMAFADALGSKRLHLGGNSMGGFIAAECAALHPDRIASLWLIDPAGVAAPEETAIVRRFKVTGEWPLLIHEPADFDQLLHAAMEHPPAMPYAVRWALAHRGMADCELHRHIASQVLRESPPLTQRYDHIATPTLIVWGSEDRILHPSCAKAFQSLLPNSKVEVMKGCGHVPMMEAPHEAAEDYLRFRAALGT